MCAVQSQSGSLETAPLSQSCSGHAWQGAYLHGGQPAGTAPQLAQAPPAAPPSPFSGVRRHPAGVQRQSDPGCTAGGVLFCRRGGGGSTHKSGLNQRGHSELANQNALLGTATTISRPVRLDDKYLMQEGLGGWWVCGSFSESVSLTLFCYSKTKIRQRLPPVPLQPQTTKVSLAGFKGHRNRATLSCFIESSEH